ncbi:MAG: hypothetical protein ABWJ42_00950 [Sulfolobales archaeon]
MSLKRLLEEEALRERLVEINKSDIIDLINQHYNMISWCARRDDMRELCNNYLDIIKRSIRTIASIRMIKMLQNDEKEAGDEPLDLVLLIRDLYMRYLYDLPIDPMDRIPVRMRADVKLEKKVLLRGRGYLLPISSGFRLILAGLAEPLSIL